MPLPGEFTYLDLPTYTKIRRRKKRRVARDKENTNTGKIILNYMKLLLRKRNMRHQMLRVLSA